METSQLQLFVALARGGAFAAVARDLGVDPSAVSRGIAALEAELNVRLFQRTTRKLALTEAGELLLARVSSPLEEIERARDELRSLRTEPTAARSAAAPGGSAAARRTPTAPGAAAALSRRRALEQALWKGAATGHSKTECDVERVPRGAAPQRDCYFATGTLDSRRAGAIDS